MPTVGFLFCVVCRSCGMLLHPQCGGEASKSAQSTKETISMVCFKAQRRNDKLRFGSSVLCSHFFSCISHFNRVSTCVRQNSFYLELGYEVHVFSSNWISTFYARWHTKENICFYILFFDSLSYVHTKGLHSFSRINSIGEAHRINRFTG